MSAGHLGHPGHGHISHGHISHGHLRTSAAERERAVDVLRAAFAEGRLDAAEYAARAGQAQQSRTYAELAELTADLPIGPLGTVLPATGPPTTGPPAAAVPAAGPAARPAPWQNVSGSAAAALVLGVVTVLARNSVADVITAILAVTLGMAALVSISGSGRQGCRPRGQALAIAGIILGTAGALAGLAFPYL